MGLPFQCFNLQYYREGVSFDGDWNACMPKNYAEKKERKQLQLLKVEACAGMQRHRLELSITSAWKWICLGIFVRFQGSGRIFTILPSKQAARRRSGEDEDVPLLLDEWWTVDHS